MLERATSFGMPGVKIDGNDVDAVWNEAHKALQRARAKGGPTFIYATGVHPEGHFLGDPLLRITRHPVKEMLKVAAPLMKSVTRIKGASIKQRTDGMRAVTSLIGKTAKERVFDQQDPVTFVRNKLKADKNRLGELELKINEQIETAVAFALNL